MAAVRSAWVRRRRAGCRVAVAATVRRVTTGSVAANKQTSKLECFLPRARRARCHERRPPFGGGKRPRERLGGGREGGAALGAVVGGELGVVGEHDGEGLAPE